MNTASTLRPARIALFGIYALLASASAFAEDQSENDKILAKARASYYSLKQKGLSEFKCTLLPDWALPFRDAKVDAQTTEKLLLKLHDVHFHLTAPAGGNVSITHNEVQADNEQQAKGFKQMFNGEVQAVTGFFQSWNGFAITPPFPPPQVKYSLKNENGLYTVAYKEGADTDVLVAMDQEMKIQSLKIDTPQFKSEIHPRFMSTVEGYLLTGYDATYEGVALTDKTVLHVSIDNQLVDGFQLPQKVHFNVVYSGQPIEGEFTLGECHATKR